MGRGFRRKIEALEEIFRFLEVFFDEAEVDERTAFTVNLVVEELFTNMVRHNTGGGTEIDLEIERVGDRIRLQLADTDVDPFDPETAPKPEVEAGIGDRRAGGLGLHLVRSMVDELDYEYEPETRRMRASAVTRLES